MRGFSPFSPDSLGPDNTRGGRSSKRVMADTAYTYRMVTLLVADWLGLLTK